MCVCASQATFDPLESWLGPHMSGYCVEWDWKGDEACPEGHVCNKHGQTGTACTPAKRGRPRPPLTGLMPARLSSLLAHMYIAHISPDGLYGAASGAPYVAVVHAAFCCQHPRWPH